MVASLEDAAAVEGDAFFMSSRASPPPGCASHPASVCRSTQRYALPALRAAALAGGPPAPRRALRALTGHQGTVMP